MLNRLINGRVYQFEVVSKEKNQLERKYYEQSNFSAAKHEASGL